MSSVLAAQVSPNMSHEGLVETARRLAPGFGAIAWETDRARDVPRASVDAMREAGLFRVFQPRRWGGLQEGPRLMFDIQNAIAEHCASTAWIYGVLSVQSFILAYFDEAAQRDVWGEDGEALACSSFAPKGKAVPVEGGYRLSGRWPYSSGSTHAQWALVGAVEDGGAVPGMRIMLVPRSQFTIDPVWDTFGLRGTGSNDLLIDDVFVPAYRTHVLSPGLAFDPAGDQPEELPYRAPWYYFFGSCIANLSVGISRGVLREFLTLAGKRTSMAVGGLLKSDPATIAEVSRFSAEIDAAEATFRRNFDTLLGHARDNTPMSLEEGLRIRLQNSSVVRDLAGGVDKLMLRVGAGGMNNASPIVRGWLDIMAARLHPGNDPAITEKMLGEMMMATA